MRPPGSVKTITKTIGPAVPKALPREPLTAKARAAILAYVRTKLPGMATVSDAVKFTLEADRMRRDALYTWLESKGLHWVAARNIWEKPIPKKKLSSAEKV